MSTARSSGMRITRQIRGVAKWHACCILRAEMASDAFHTLNADELARVPGGVNTRGRQQPGGLGQGQVVPCPYGQPGGPAGGMPGGADAAAGGEDQNAPTVPDVCA